MKQPGEEATGKNWKKVWEYGENRASDEYWETYAFPKGRPPNFYCVLATGRAIEEVSKMGSLKDPPTELWRNPRHCVKILLEGWKSFREDPARHEAELRAAASLFTVRQARRHVLDNKAFPRTKGGSGLLSASEVQALVEYDILFYQQAFVEVSSNPRRLTGPQAELHLREDWRFWNSSTYRLCCVYMSWL